MRRRQLAADLVYIVRPGENEELRISLRSVAANLPHGRVWIVGGGPEWLTGVGRIQHSDGANKYAHTWGSITRAVEHPGVSNPFLLMNDDFMIVAPVTTIGPLHRGPLAAVVDDYRTRYGDSGYLQVAERTLNLLRDHGHDEPLCYDLHTPCLIDKEAMQRTRAVCEGHAGRVLWQTVHGNLRGQTGTRHDDVKIRSIAATNFPSPFLSTTDDTFARGKVGAHLRNTFRKPSPYES